MTSFRLAVTPHRRAASRFIDRVHRRLQQAYADAPSVTQTEIARTIGVHRSVISRQLRGTEDMSVGRVAEIAHILGFEAEFVLLHEDQTDGRNTPLSDNSSPFKTVEITLTSAAVSNLHISKKAE